MSERRGFRIDLPQDVSRAYEELHRQCVLSGRLPPTVTGEKEFRLEVFKVGIVAIQSMLAEQQKGEAPDEPLIHRP